MTSSGNIAIFDLDYTLTKKGTWGRFVVSTMKTRPHLWLPVLFVMAKNQWLYKQDKAPRCGVKKAMMKLTMVGWPKEKVVRYAQAFAEREVLTGLRPGAIASLNAHKEAGDTLIIASAAVDVVVEPIARRLGVAHFIATELAWNEGKLSPEFATENCYGAEKLLRIKTYLAKNPTMKHNLTKITMYSDNHSDLDIMLWADVGIAVDPSKRLKTLANQHGLRVVNWM